MTYKQAFLLYKTYNNEEMSHNWTNLFFNQQFNARTHFAYFINNSKYKIGINTIISNRFLILNGKIPLNWLNEAFDSFKIKCKVLFLSW